MQPGQQSPWGASGQQSPSPWGASGQENPSGWGASASYAPAASYASGYYPPAPKSRTTALLVGLVLVPLVILLLIVLAKGFSSTAGMPPIDVTPPPTFAFPAPTVAGPEDPSPEPEDAGGYKNDDYVVPEADPKPPRVPKPETYGEATDWLENNPIYAGQVPVPVRCEVDTVPAKSSAAKLSRYLNDLTACLMRVWANEITDAGYYAARPTVYVYNADSGRTPCGRLKPQNAFYCVGNKQIYYSEDFYEIMPQFKGEWVVPLYAVAHEFGHGIQGFTGIERAEDAWERRYDKDGNEWGALEMLRRLEFQADCFTGQFAGAVGLSLGITDEEYETLLQIAVAIGDDTMTGDTEFVGDHGRGYNRRAWFETGFRNGPIGTCNSFDPNIPLEDLA